MYGARVIVDFRNNMAFDAAFTKSRTGISEVADPYPE